MKENIVKLKEKLKITDTSKIKMVIGFDGFVDNIIKVVDKRTDTHNYKPVETIEDFGNKILAAKGLSANMEMVITKSKLGGNGPIFANALIEYGTDITYVGLLGENGINHVFEDMAKRCTTYSIGDPGITDALEFYDGKLLMGKCEVLKEANWENLCKHLGGVEGVVKLFDNANLIGMENWTMLTEMSDLWKHYIDEAFPLLREKDVKPLAFFDLADPERRTDKDVLEAMNLISKFSEKYKVILGLNEKEAYEIAEILGVKVDSTLDDTEKLKKTTKGIYENMDIYCLVVHPTKEAIACCNGEIFHSDGFFCSKPKLTTGAGDNFNCGFCLGQSIGLDTELSLLLGTSTSGFYVRNGRSPSLNDLIGFLEEQLN